MAHKSTSNSSSVDPAPKSATESAPNAAANAPAGSAAREVGVGPLAAELRVAIMRTSRKLRAEAASPGVSPGQYSVLAAVADQPHTVGHLAAREQIQAPSMTRIVNALAAAELVVRTENPLDKRQVLVSITASGAAALARARNMRTAWLARRVKALTAEQRATLHEAALILQEMSA